MILSGKNAVITGGSQGLGLAIAAEFVRHGATVGLLARNVERLLEAQKQLKALRRSEKQKVFIAVVPHKLDFRLPIDFWFERLDILVNNAGITGPMGPIEGQSFSRWAETIQTNLMLPAYMCQLAIPNFKKHKKGNIINISGGGATNPRPNFSAYASSKAGVVRLTDTLAEELKDFNIRVNAVAPGKLDTAMCGQIREAGYGDGKEFNSMSDAVHLVRWLASEESEPLTGRLISAVWDDWPNIDPKTLGPDKYTLRRIV